MPSPMRDSAESGVPAAPAAPATSATIAPAAAAAPAAPADKVSEEERRAFYRAENEDDDGYDPYSDRRPMPEPLFERDPWA